jgi:glycosyltransferase involved in cell wall biosynthesis
LRLLIATDAWHPQVNGVVRSLDAVAGEIRKLGHEVHILSPADFRTVPCPTYPEIRLAVLPGRRLGRLIDAMAPTSIHIATEGPIGLSARRYCVKRGLAYTTSLHTRFPEYVHARTGLPVSWGYALMRWFHGPATRVMVATETLRQELQDMGLHDLGLWSRGVDTALFHPRDFHPQDRGFLDLPRPIAIYVGRVAVEKNIGAFLKLKLPGTKIVVGDGPQLSMLRRRYRHVIFTGNLTGEDLARHYAAADVFVFPSRTDTFGNVILEALASGVPVAAYPVAGPLDVMGDAPVGCLDTDLRVAVRRALTVSPAICRAYAEKFSWRESALQFIGNLTPVTAHASMVATLPVPPNAVEPPARSWR